MASDSMAMLNVRLDREVKEAGDRFLAEMGVSVTEVIRALWTKLAADDKREARRQIEAILATETPSERQTEVERKLQALRDFDGRLLRFQEELGLDPANHIPLSDDKDEIAAARWEYLQEKWDEVA